MAGDGDTTEPVVSRPATTSAPPVPERLGRFVVVDRVGEGGMGVVYRARDPSLDRDVAIKVVASTRGDAASRERLLREAQALGRMAHPNVVSVYEVGAHDGMLFIAMELVPGETLGQWLERETRGWAEILEKFIQAGRGLGAAHRAGILHRDFKPSNVVVATDGRARVIDFGVARAADVGATIATDSVPLESPLSSALTEFGTLVGTPSYMSPEHFSGEVSAASDQWSLCTAIYRALFQQSPFEAENVALLRVAIANDEPRVPNRGEVPAPVVDAIMRGLRREPAARWASVDALADALELELQAAPPRDSNPLLRYRRIGAVMLGAVAISIEVFRDHRGDAKHMRIEEHLVYVLVGLTLVLAFAFWRRRDLRQSSHNRRLTLVFILALGIPAIHRTLALGVANLDMAFVLRTDAVIAAGLYLFAAVTVERWLIRAAAVMALYVPLTYLAPVTVGPAYGGALATITMIALWSWRDRPSRRHFDVDSRAS